MSNSQSNTNIETIRKIYAAFAVGDVPTVLAAFSKDIIWNEAENFIYADGNPYIGPDAIVGGVFMRLGTEWENFRLDNISFYNVEDDRVLATGRYRGTCNATGKKLDAQFAHFWKLSDGLITSFQQYTDTKQAAEVSKTDSE